MFTYVLIIFTFFILSFLLYLLANRALHMDRKMREGMRHSYRAVRQAFKAADTENTGME